MHVYPKQNTLEQWEAELIYHTREEWQKCQLGTEEQRRKNKLNLPQTVPRDKKKIRKLFAKPNAHNKTQKRATLTLKLCDFSQAMFIIILM